MDYRQYHVSRRNKAPLLHFIKESLETCGCQVLRISEPDGAPFRITFEAPDGERIGILAYAFYANCKATKNRPADEHRFQVKYGSKDGALHSLWQDPFELYTTLFFGINPDRKFFVAADPLLHSPTRFFISIEFKEDSVERIQEQGWFAWERTKRSKGLDEPVETLIGGTPEHFLRYVRFERAAKCLSPGHRALLADKLGVIPHARSSGSKTEPERIESSRSIIHELSLEFELAESDVLDLIQSAPRLKMAVRGWVAEAHLEKQLRALPEIKECVRIEEDGKPDFKVSLHDERPLYIECKNVLRRRTADGTIRVDFQSTRASKSDPCTRYYLLDEFEIVAACLHACTEKWEFEFATVDLLAPHKSCPGRLSNLVRLDERWTANPMTALGHALDLR